MSEQTEREKLIEQFKTEYAYIFEESKHDMIISIVDIILADRKRIVAPLVGIDLMQFDNAPFAEIRKTLKLAGIDALNREG